MPKLTPRARMQFIQREQFELLGQLQSLTHSKASPFSLHRAVDLIQQWLALNRLWRQSLLSAMTEPKPAPRPVKLPVQKARAAGAGG